MKYSFDNNSCFFLEWFSLALVALYKVAQTKIKCQIYLAALMREMYAKSHSISRHAHMILLIPLIF